MLTPPLSVLQREPPWQDTKTCNKMLPVLDSGYLKKNKKIGLPYRSSGPAIGPAALAPWVGGSTLKGQGLCDVCDVKWNEKEEYFCGLYLNFEIMLKFPEAPFKHTHPLMASKAPRSDCTLCATAAGSSSEISMSIAFIFSERISIYLYHWLT